VISKSVSLAGLAMRMFALLFASCNKQNKNITNELSDGHTGLYQVGQLHDSLQGLFSLSDGLCQPRDGVEGAHLTVPHVHQITPNPAMTKKD
jgi:hypothetical protein